MNTQTNTLAENTPMVGDFQTYRMLDAIQKSFENLEKNNTIDEIKEMIDEHQSHLCAEYRPSCSSLDYIFDKIHSTEYGDSDAITLIDIIDDLWISLCYERYGK